MIARQITPKQHIMFSIKTLTTDDAIKRYLLSTSPEVVQLGNVSNHYQTIIRLNSKYIIYNSIRLDLDKLKFVEPFTKKIISYQDALTPEEKYKAQEEFAKMLDPDSETEKICPSCELPMYEDLYIKNRLQSPGITTIQAVNTLITYCPHCNTSFEDED